MRRLGRILGALSTGHWLATIGAPIVAVVLGAAQRLSWPWLLALAFGVILVVFGSLLAYYDLTSPRPKVVWKGSTSYVFPRKDLAVDQQTGDQVDVWHRFPLTAIEVGVANDPPFRRPASRLNDAALWLSFFLRQGETEEPILETNGAWGFDPNSVLAEASLPPNNQHRKFAVAIKHDGEDDWYAASPDLWHHRELRIPSHKLPDSFIVRITLRGTGLIVDESWWLDVHSGQPGTIARG